MTQKKHKTGDLVTYLGMPAEIKAVHTQEAAGPYPARTSYKVRYKQANGTIATANWVPGNTIGTLHKIN